MKEALIEHLQFRIQQCKSTILKWCHQRFLKKQMTTSPVANDELLARFVLRSDWIRADQTIRQNAFIPHPYPDLSVTRHKQLSEKQIWSVGRDVATARKHTLYGRADVSTVNVRQQSLAVEPQPVQGNPNHATITGWPADKAAQKIIALELAAASTYRSYIT